jgi:probable rRNA maturation factor
LGSFFGQFSLVILQKKVAGLTERAVERFVLRARRAAGLRGRANVLVTSSVELRLLNRRFRGQDKPTDVLSFPAAPAATRERGRKFAGDVAISADVARENAARFGHSTAEEVKVLALHGILHLAGFDHERDNGHMARTEARLRKKLRLPSVLTERAQSDRTALPERSRGETGLRTRT